MGIFNRESQANLSGGVAQSISQHCKHNSIATEIATLDTSKLYTILSVTAANMKLHHTADIQSNSIRNDIICVLPNNIPKSSKTKPNRR